MKRIRHKLGFTGQELLKLAAVWVLLSGLMAYIFYNLWWMAIVFLPGLYPFLLMESRKKREKLREELNLQFKDALNSLAASLHAGYVIENALKEARQEITELYGKDSLMARELAYMISQMNLNRTAEEVFEEFGKRSGLEDVQNFASIFSLAKRSSGGLVSIMDATAGAISQKLETRREIKTIIQAKRYEQRLMNLIPLGMILYMRLGNGEFMQALYEGAGGRLLMTICFAVYLSAYYMGEKIVNIRI